MQPLVDLSGRKKPTYFVIVVQLNVVPYVPLGNVYIKSKRVDKYLGMELKVRDRCRNAFKLLPPITPICYNALI